MSLLLLKENQAPYRAIEPLRVDYYPLPNSQPFLWFLREDSGRYFPCDQEFACEILNFLLQQGLSVTDIANVTSIPARYLKSLLEKKVVEVKPAAFAELLKLYCKYSQ